MLSTALQRATTGLATVSQQIDVVTRNVSNRGDANAVRKTAQLTTAPGGGVRVAAVVRTANADLLAAMLTATSTASGVKVANDALSGLQSLIGEANDERSPAALLGKLGDALQLYAANPADSERGRSVVDTARTLAAALNDAADGVASARAATDDEIAATVTRVNDRLAKLDAVNRRVVVGTLAGIDVSDDMDQRDGILKDLSADIGLRTVPRANGDIAIYTDSGVTLFETTAREVSFQRVPLAPGQVGSVISIDGVPVAGAGQTMALESGRLRALVDMRDATLEQFSAQLDEVSRALVAAFAESPAGSLGAPDLPGLFTAAGATSVFPDGVRVPGLASIISINATYDAAQGGDASRVRDGGANGSTYLANATGAEGYTARIVALVANLSSDRAFAGSADLGGRKSLQAFATDAVAWLGRNRQSTSDELTYRTAVSARATDALKSDTGVSLDQEMSHMLELERSYQASSRLLTTIDDMYQALLQATK